MYARVKIERPAFGAHAAFPDKIEVPQQLPVTVEDYHFKAEMESVEAIAEPVRGDDGAITGYNIGLVVRTAKGGHKRTLLEDEYVVVSW